MSGRLRRSRCMNWPSPIEGVSPSPGTPMPRMFRLARSGPVAPHGMRPGAELKPWARLRTEAGDIGGVEFEPHHLQQLPIAILIDDVDSIVAADEIDQILVEWIRAQP